MGRKLAAVSGNLKVLSCCILGMGGAICAGMKSQYDIAKQMAPECVEVLFYNKEHFVPTASAKILRPYLVVAIYIIKTENVFNLCRYQGVISLCLWSIYCVSGECYCSVISWTLY